MFNIKNLFNKKKIIEFVERENCFIEGYRIDSLEKNDTFLFSSFIKEKDMKYFKYIKKDALIEFTGDNFDNVFKCIKVLLDNGIKNIEIFIYDKNYKKKFDNYLNNNILEDTFNNIHLKLGYNSVTLNNYISCEKILNNIIKPALNLSPLEKYVYAYNVTKHFKEYKEDENNKRNARDLYKVLNNDYMVCVGFSQLLSDLLDKLNLNSVGLDIVVYSEESSGGHRRNYVYLKDDKYDIDGFYFSDPTFDKDFIEDKYNHMLFTDKKNTFSIYIENLTEQLVFNSSSIFEFNRNYNICLQRLNIENKDLLKYIIDTIKELDPNYIKDLRNRFKIIKGSISIYVDDKKYNKMLMLKNELGKYIVSKVNKEIDKEKIKNAIRVIYDKFYGFSDKNKMDEYLEKVFEYNEERESQVFPLLEKNKTYVKKL